MTKKSLRLFAAFSLLLIFGVFNSLKVNAVVNKNITERISGSSRIMTSINISKAGWEKASNVIITSELNYQDVLLASSISKLKDSPILLSGQAKLDPALLVEIKRLKANKAIIIGNANTISYNVELQLKKLNISVTRIGGLDNYDRAKKISEITGFNNGVVVAGNQSYPDIISIAPIAGLKAMPILIASKNVMNPKISGLVLNASIPVTYFLGNSNILSTSLEKGFNNIKRFSAESSYLNNINIINEFSGDMSFDTLYLTSGKDYSKSLLLSAIAAKNRAPVILSDVNLISKETINFIKSKNVKHVVILGGYDEVSKSVETSISSAIASIVHPSSIILNKTEDVLTIGSNEILSAVINPLGAYDKSVIWASSNNKVATVDKIGRVNAVGLGTAIITAATVDGGKTSKCAITVVKPEVKVQSIVLNKSSLALDVGQQGELTAKVSPDTASNKALMWISTNEGVATVDPSGKINALKEGVTTISAISIDGGDISAWCTVTVKNPVVNVESISLDKNNEVLQVGSTDKLIVTVSPSNASNKYITWKSSNTDVAEVDLMGNIKAVTTGSAIITATTADGKITAACEIIVTESSENPVPPAKAPLIFAIDIGHNAKYNTGAVGIRTEDSCTKEVGLLVMEKLRNIGYAVIDVAPKNPTSQNDSLKQRVDAANAAHADYFLSIHFNKFDGNANGSEIYYGSNKSKNIAQDILNNLVALGYANRGNHDNSKGLYVLKYTKMPSMLVECSFIDNKHDMDLYDPDAIAEAIVSGLISDN